MGRAIGLNGGTSNSKSTKPTVRPSDSPCTLLNQLNPNQITLAFRSPLRNEDDRVNSVEQNGVVSRNGVELQDGLVHLFDGLPVPGTFLPYLISFLPLAPIHQANGIAEGFRMGSEEAANNLSSEI